MISIFFLLTIATGLSCVDMNLWCRNFKRKGTHNATIGRRQFESAAFETEYYYEMKIKNY